MNVYKLEADPEHFQNLGTVDDEDVDRLIDGFSGKPMAGSWTPIPVKVLISEPDDARRPPSDFPSFYSTAWPVFSARAVDELADLLDGRGELLPLLSSEGEYYVFNVTRLSDALDGERTEFKRFSDGRVMNISEYAFDPKAVESETIFKLPQIPEMYTFATDRFAERVRERELEGFEFQPVWEGLDP